MTERVAAMESQASRVRCEPMQDVACENHFRAVSPKMSKDERTPCVKGHILIDMNRWYRCVFPFRQERFFICEKYLI